MFCLSYHNSVLNQITFLVEFISVKVILWCSIKQSQLIDSFFLLILKHLNQIVLLFLINYNLRVHCNTINMITFILWIFFPKQLKKLLRLYLLLLPILFQNLFSFINIVCWMIGELLNDLKTQFRGDLLKLSVLEINKEFLLIWWESVIFQFFKALLSQIWKVVNEVAKYFVYWLLQRLTVFLFLLNAR